MTESGARPFRIHAGEAPGEVEPLQLVGIDHHQLAQHSLVGRFDQIEALAAKTFQHGRLGLSRTPHDHPAHWGKTQRAVDEHGMLAGLDLR